MFLSSDLGPSRAESMSDSCLQLKPSNKCLAKRGTPEEHTVMQTSSGLGQLD